MLYSLENHNKDIQMLTNNYNPGMKRQIVPDKLISKSVEDTPFQSNEKQLSDMREVDGSKTKVVHVNSSAADITVQTEEGPSQTSIDQKDEGQNKQTVFSRRNSFSKPKNGEMRPEDVNYITTDHLDKPEEPKYFNNQTPNKKNSFKLPFVKEVTSSPLLRQLTKDGYQRSAEKSEAFLISPRKVRVNLQGSLPQTVDLQVSHQESKSARQHVADARSRLEESQKQKSDQIQKHIQDLIKQSSHQSENHKQFYKQLQKSKQDFRKLERKSISRKIRQFNAAREAQKQMRESEDKALKLLSSRELKAISAMTSPNESRTLGNSKSTSNIKWNAVSLVNQSLPSGVGFSFDQSGEVKKSMNVSLKPLVKRELPKKSRRKVDNFKKVDQSADNQTLSQNTADPLQPTLQGQGLNKEFKVDFDPTISLAVKNQSPKKEASIDVASKTTVKLKSSGNTFYGKNHSSGQSGAKPKSELPNHLMKIDFDKMENNSGMPPIKTPNAKSKQSSSFNSQALSYVKSKVPDWVKDKDYPQGAVIGKKTIEPLRSSRTKSYSNGSQSLDKLSGTPKPTKDVRDASFDQKELPDITIASGLPRSRTLDKLTLADAPQFGKKAKPMNVMMVGFNKKHVLEQLADYKASAQWREGNTGLVKMDPVVSHILTTRSKRKVNAKAINEDDDENDTQIVKEKLPPIDSSHDQPHVSFSVLKSTDKINDTQDVSTIINQTMKRSNTTSSLNTESLADELPSQPPPDLFKRMVKAKRRSSVFGYFEKNDVWHKQSLDVQRMQIRILSQIQLASHDKILTNWNHCLQKRP